MSDNRLYSTGLQQILSSLRDEPSSIREEIEEIRGEEKESLIWYQTEGGRWRIKIRRR